MQWTKQSEQTVYSNRWFSVNLADVALPDGRHLDHFLIRLRPVAVATVVNEANEVLLLWRHKDNIRRLLSGEEGRVAGKTSPPPQDPSAGAP